MLPTDNFLIAIKNMEALYPSIRVIATGHFLGGVQVHLTDESGEMSDALFSTEQMAIRFIYGWLTAENTRLEKGLNL